MNAKKYQDSKRSKFYVPERNILFWRIYKGRRRFKIKYVEALGYYYSYLNLFPNNLIEIY